MADELPVYPIGQISINGGNLKECKQGSLKLSNGAELVHTLGGSPSGIVFKNEDCSGQMVFVVSEKEPEFNIMQAVQKRSKKSFRFKCPLHNYEVTGAFGEADLSFSRDSAITITATFVGKIATI